MNDAALFLVTHGSRDRRSWLALQNLVSVARSKSALYIGGGCLEGQELSLAQQLMQFADEVNQLGGTEIIIMPVFLLAGVHVSEDIPTEVAIAQNQLSEKLQKPLKFRITPHLGTDSQISSLLLQQFEKYRVQEILSTPSGSIPNHTLINEKDQGRILIAHGTQRMGANQAIEDLANDCHAIAAYWGVEPKIETQIEKLLAQGITKIDVLPYFLTEGGITEAVAKKLQIYSDRLQIRQLPVPLSSEQIVDLLWKFI